MKRSILHVGGHADGEYRDIELVEMADGGWQLTPGYTLREMPTVNVEVADFSRMQDLMSTEFKIRETYYVRERICYGDECIDVYIDYKSRASNPGALVKALLAGYRQPKGD
jgi:hypothetical protein